MDIKDEKDKNATPKLSSLQSASAGAISGFVTRAILQPFDVLKIRFQLQIESTKRRKGGLYQGLFQATRTIVRDEGLFALWKGHVPAQFLSVTFGAGQFCTFTYCKKKAEELGYKDDGKVLSICGGLGGFVGTISSFPFDLARTKLVAQSRKQFSGTLDVWRKDLAKENVFSLWKGLTPTLLMTVPYSAIQFRIYYLLSNMLPTGSVEGLSGLGIGLSKPAFCGAAAGVCAKIVVYPLDVLKKRVQIRGSEHVREGFGKVVVYQSLWDCVRKITREEGLLAWFKGLKATLIKSALVSGCLFSVYEISCDAILAMEALTKDKR